MFLLIASAIDERPIVNSPTTLMVFLPLRNNTGHPYYIEVRKRGVVWFCTNIWVSTNK